MSLPTIQNIEGGRGNPTWEVLEKIGKALSVHLEWRPSPIDWEEGIALGLPLLAQAPKSSGVPTADRLVRFLRAVFQARDSLPLADREAEAIAALLMALKQHYPRFYRERIQCESAEGLVAAVQDTPKVIKLRRISLEKIGGYL